MASNGVFCWVVVGQLVAIALYPLPSLIVIIACVLLAADKFAETVFSRLATGHDNGCGAGERRDRLAVCVPWPFSLNNGLSMVAIDGLGFMHQCVLRYMITVSLLAVLKYDMCFRFYPQQ